MTGRGTVVTGTVWSGSVGEGDTVAWLPAGRDLTVRGVQSHGRSVERAHRGDRAAVNLLGVHHDEIHRGHELATPGFLHPTRLLTVHLRVLPDSPWPIRHRCRSLSLRHFHAHLRQSLEQRPTHGQYLRELLPLQETGLRKAPARIHLS